MTTAAAAETIETETVLLIPIDELHRSPTNPRKHNKEPDADFVDSIRQKGVLQPIIVRVRPAGGYEVVFGDTRRRGSQLAGKSHVPCIVRDMTDDEAYEAQVIENAHRRDLHPIDEADSFAGLVKRGRTPEDIASKIGRPTSYVLHRLKLCELSKACREALDDGRLQLGVALQIARIPGHKLQDDALDHVAPSSHSWKKGDGIVEMMPLALATEEIRERFMLRLVDAPFDRADPKLVPKAGACSVCPKRTGNQAELFNDVKSPDLCTDPLCFRSKLDARFKVISVEAKTSGREILSAKEAKNIFNRYDEERLNYGAKWAKLDEQPAKIKKALAAKGAKVTVAQNPNSGRIVELVSKSVIEGAERSAKNRAGGGAASTRAKVTPQEKARRELQALKADAQEACDAAIVRDAVAQIEQLEPDQADGILFPLLLEHVLDNIHGDGPDKLCQRRGLPKPKQNLYRWFDKAIEGLLKSKPPELWRGVLLELVLPMLLEDESKLALEAAKLLGVDAKKLAATALAEVKAKKAGTPAKGVAGVCRECGCTDEEACDGGCTWVEPDLCSSCVGKAKAKAKAKPKRKPRTKQAFKPKAAKKPKRKA